MTALRNRKRRLKFETDQEIRYRSKMRPVIVEPNAWFCAVRLKGTRVRYEIAWETIFKRAAMIHADKLRAERKLKRKRG